VWLHVAAGALLAYAAYGRVMAAGGGVIAAYNIGVSGISNNVAAAKGVASVAARSGIVTWPRRRVCGINVASCGSAA